jgi:prophage antirepressor-like protein
MASDEAIVQSDKVEMRAKVPRELYQEALYCGAAMGLNKTDIVVYALQKLVDDLGTQTLKQDFVRRKAAEHGISEQQIYGAVMDAYEDMAQRRRSNLPDG